MKPLIVLLVAFVIALVGTKINFGSFEIALSGRIALSTMLLFTASAHFVFTKGMTMMIPFNIPGKIGIIYLTGIIEVVAAVGLLIAALREVTGWLIIFFFILLLPASIYAAAKNIDYQKGNFNGNGLSYLWFRIPLQILFIAWTYIRCIRV